MQKLEMGSPRRQYCCRGNALAEEEAWNEDPPVRCTYGMHLTGGIQTHTLNGKVIFLSEKGNGLVGCLYNHHTKHFLVYYGSSLFTQK